MKEQWWQGRERREMRPGLERMQQLMAVLGHPERRYPIVHVAGTNGKGSVAQMIATALISQGYRVGLNTSPDLGQINERVMIDQKPLDSVLWDVWGDEIESAGRSLKDIPTFFEAVTALAFLAFARLSVDIAVVEVGLGGRLDATNVIEPAELCVVTAIAFDHMDRLGYTIDAIAREKAGIFKPGSRAVIARQPFSLARQTLLAQAERVGISVREPSVRARATERGAVVDTPEAGEVRVPLLGAYQADNLDTAWTALQELAERGWIRDWQRVKTGLAQVKWPGRFQVVRRHPLWVLDGAHNPHGIEGVVNTLQREPWNRYRWHLLFAVLKDKPGLQMLDLLLPWVASVVVTRVPSERGTDPELLAAHIPPTWRPEPVLSLVDALERVKSRVAADNDAVLITGSLSLLMHLTQLGILVDA